MPEGDQAQQICHAHEYPSNGWQKNIRCAESNQTQPFMPIYNLFLTALLISIHILPAPLFSVSTQDELLLAKPLIKKWAYNTNDTSVYTPTVHENLIFLPLDGGTLVALSKHTGTIQWRAEIGGKISASPVADERGAYVATEIDTVAAKGSSPMVTGNLRLIGRQTGVTLWLRTLATPIRTTLTVNQNMLFAGTEDGKLYSIKTSDGEINWMKSNPTPFKSNPIISGGKLYIGDETGTLHAIEKNSGQTLWRYRTRGPLRAPVAFVPDNGLVIVGSADSTIYALSEQTGRLRWRARAGAAVQSVVGSARCVIATSLDNFVYCLAPQSGRRIWKRQLSGRVLSQPLVTSDGILFAPLAGDECIILDLLEGKKINSVNVGEDNNTAASPVRAGPTLLLTTQEGLMAYANGP